jgi:hypothetical protein
VELERQSKEKQRLLDEEARKKVEEAKQAKRLEQVILLNNHPRQLCVFLCFVSSFFKILYVLFICFFCPPMFRKAGNVLVREDETFCLGMLNYFICSFILIILIQRILVFQK